MVMSIIALKKARESGLNVGDIANLFYNPVIENNPLSYTFYACTVAKCWNSLCITFVQAVFILELCVGPCASMVEREVQHRVAACTTSIDAFIIIAK